MRAKTVRFVAIGALALMTVSASAEAGGKAAPLPVAKRAGSEGKSVGVTGTPEVAIMVLGVGLAAWARTARDPIALAVAGKIVDSSGARQVEKIPPKETGGSTPARRTGEKQSGSLKAEDLIAEARAMASGNDKAIAAIEEVVVSLPKARGRKDGPVYWKDCIDQESSDTWREITFEGDQKMEIYVSGDGDSDLDCSVYDENGKMLSYDDGSTDVCELYNMRGRPGPFTLKISNVGEERSCYVIQKF